MTKPRDIGSELIASMQEAVAWARGEPVQVRIHEPKADGVSTRNIDKQGETSDS